VTNPSGPAASNPRWQTGVSIVSTLIAALALLVTGLTLMDQQTFNDEQIDFNRHQLKINDAEQARREAAYASRVYFWTYDESRDYDDLALTLRIENRSPAPLTRAGVIFSKDADRPFAIADPGIIPPCSSVTLRPRFFKDFEVDLVDRLNRSDKIGVAFFDANQRAWQRNLTGELVSLGGNEFGEDGPFQNPRAGINGPWLASGAVSVSSTPDCSEGAV
jgi:hypothetical protein